MDKVENIDKQQQHLQLSCSSTSSPDEEDHVSEDVSVNVSSTDSEHRQQQPQQQEEEEIVELIEENEGIVLDVQSRLLRELFTFDTPEPSTRVLSDLLGQIIVGQKITADDKARYEAAAPGAVELFRLIDQYIDTESGEGCSKQPEANEYNKNVDSINIVKTGATLSNASR